MTDLARMILSMLSVLMVASLVANGWAGKLQEALFAFFMLLVGVLGLVLIHLRLRSNRLKWMRRSAELRGLGNCPISHSDLRELLEFLNRPKPPECRLRLYETYEFLSSRGLETEKTLEWLNANGAKCDCEVIMNTSYQYGPDVGFDPDSDAQEEG